LSKHWVVALAYALCGLLPVPLRAQSAVAVTDVTVIDATGAKPKLDQTVVVADGRIVAVGRTRRVKLPEGAQTVDGTGKFLIPGLWDMHVHGTGAPHFSELYIASGVTGVRDMFGPMADIQAERKAIQNGQAGPHIVAAGRIVDGPKPVWPGSIAVKDADEGRKAVNTVKQEGSDFVKVYSLLPRDAYFAIAAEAKRQGMVFAGHVPETISAVEASDAGQKSIEHLTGVLKGCSTREDELLHPDSSIPLTQSMTASLATALDSYDEKRAQALFARLKRNHTWQCPTLTVLDHIAHVNDGSLVNDPRLKYMPAGFRSFWNPTNDFRFKNADAKFYAAVQRANRQDEEIVGKMRRAGVEFLAGTDVCNPYCFPGFSLHEELARLVHAGLTPMEALQAATINPARYLGKDREMGSIRPGKLADLVLLDADPLEDIHNTARIRAVFANGRMYDRSALDKFLHDAEAGAK
jgi:imidazolonepropionase-like amidohydrolase